jgi:hypothetical protein
LRPVRPDLVFLEVFPQLAAAGFGVEKRIADPRADGLADPAERNEQEETN